MAASMITQYARPGDGYDSRITTEIAVSYARGLIKLFIELHGDEISDGSKGVIDLILRAVEEGLSFDQVWDDALGGIENLFAGSERHAAADVAARVALKLAAQSQNSGSFGGSLNREGRVRWKGWLLPPADAIEFDCDGRCATIVLRDDRECLEFEFVDGSVTGGAETATALHRVGSSENITLLPAQTIIMGRSFCPSEEPLQNIGEDVSAIFEESMEILDRYTPHYGRWVTEIIRGVLCYPRREARSFSGSWFDKPGTIYMAMLDDPLEVASVLIHEASHQYFHLVSRLVDYVDANDRREYYSPPVKKARPLFNILIAYHAFANIVLFFRECDRLGILDSEVCKREYEKFSGFVAELDRPLRGNRSLTNAGLCLYEPLARAIGDL